MKGGDEHEESQEARKEEGLLSQSQKRELAHDAHRKVKGALRELRLAYESLDKLKEMW